MTRFMLQTSGIHRSTRLLLSTFYLPIDCPPEFTPKTTHSGLDAACGGRSFLGASSRQLHTLRHGANEHKFNQTQSYRCSRCLWRQLALARHLSLQLTSARLDVSAQLPCTSLSGL